MALKINKTLNQSGLTIPTGSIIIHTPTFKPVLKDDGQGGLEQVHELHANFELYASMSEYEAGNPSIKGVPNEFDKMAIVKELTSAEYGSLETDTGVLSKVETWVQEEVENFSGMSSGDTERVTPFTT